MNQHYLSSTLRVTAVSLSLGLAMASIPAYSATLLEAIPTGGSTQVSESGAVDYYTVRLMEKPDEDVTVTFVLDGQVLVFPRAVTFDSTNFNTPKTITVSAVNDKTPEGAHSGTISHTMSSTDPDFNSADNVNAAPITASITDDDLASVTATESGGSTQVAEGGAPDSYTLVLSTRPVADVTIAIRSETPDGQRPGPAEGSAQLTVNPSSVTFTPENWAPRMITITAVDDAQVDGTQSETLVHVISSSDTAYNQRPVNSVTASVADNDSVGVLLSQSGGFTRVVEGGAADSYTLVLSSEPATSVSVTLIAGDGDKEQVTVTPPRVSFTPTNYATPQTITVSAVDDAFGEGPHAATINHTVSSTDLAYQGVTVSPVTASITDNDIPAVLVSESGDSSQVAEGGAIDSYTLVLTTQPADVVAIDIKPGSQLSASPARLTFSAANYATPQTITVKAVDDLVVEDTQLDTVSHTVSSADFGYDGIAADSVIATVTDNDSRGVVLSETGGSTRVTEGAADGDRYSITLSAKPLSDVTITITPDAQLTVEPASLTFTPDNFATPQSVTVGAVNNEVANGTRMAGIRHSMSSADSDYNFPVAALSVSITDDDVAAVLLEESDSSTGVAESGGSDSYTLRLATQPVANVTVTVYPGDQLEASPATLTFTAANYADPQSVTVEAVDDAEVEGEHMGTLTHRVSSTDGAYEDIRVSELTVEIVDNDEPAVPPPPPTTDPQVDAPSQGGGSGGGSLSLMTLACLLGFCPLTVCFKKNQG